jgi:hypothetical protein
LTRPFDASLQSAKAALAKSVADLAQARQRTDVLQAQAQLADAQAVFSKTQQDLARIGPLAREKAVTEIELDAAIAAQKSAKANVDARQANVTNLEASVKYTILELKPNLGNEARVIQAELDLSYCDIYSPISGTIGFQQADEKPWLAAVMRRCLATVSLVGCSRRFQSQRKSVPQDYQPRQRGKTRCKCQVRIDPFRRQQTSGTWQFQSPRSNCRSHDWNNEGPGELPKSG